MPAPQGRAEMLTAPQGRAEMLSESKRVARVRKRKLRKLLVVYGVCVPACGAVVRRPCAAGVDKMYEQVALIEKTVMAAQLEWIQTKVDRVDRVETKIDRVDWPEMKIDRMGGSERRGARKMWMVSPVVRAELCA